MTIAVLGYENNGVRLSVVSIESDPFGPYSISDDLFIEAQTDIVDKYLKVFKDIFILTKHKGHYDMMMGIETDANS